MIVGLTGLKRAGKSSVANILKDRYGFHVRSFATPIKDMLTELGVPREYVWDPELKEKPVPGFGKSARQMLCTLGTEWGRELVSDDIWVRALETRLTDLEGRDVVIDDVRFLNEALMIKRQPKGCIVHVVRPGLDRDSHVSESGLPNDLVDGEIRNLSCYLPDLEKEVINFVEMGKYGPFYDTEFKCEPSH